MHPRQPEQWPGFSLLWKSHQASWKLSVVLVLLALTQVLAFAMQQTPRRLDTPRAARKAWHQPPHPEPILSSAGPAIRPEDFAALLQETLSQYNIAAEKSPVFFQRQVYKWLHDYTVLHRRELEGMLRRAAPYLPVIKPFLRQQQIPDYFAYVPLVESAFEAEAIHPQSGARGLWQLLPGTARAYGLRVSQTIDERLDPLRATYAASRYLQELQAIFGKHDPLLILAAYNFGENNLSKAIVRGRTRDIWSLMRKRLLPYQTRNYLVKMVALWVIVTHTEYFQFSLEAAKLPVSFTEITFPHAVTFTQIAEQTAIPVDQLQKLNPHVLTAHIPAHVPIRVPFSSMAKQGRFEIRLTSPLSSESCCERPLTAETCWHTVEPGESLSVIARRYSIDLMLLKFLNQLEGPDPVIRSGQRLLVCDTSPAKIAATPIFW